jgi:dihydrofolate reductase
MTASADGYVTDASGGIGWTTPSDDLLADQHEHVAGLGAYLLGRRLYETMRPWDTDPALSATASGAAFARVWAALPKVVFSRTLEEVDPSARLATGSVAEEVAAALRSTTRDVAIGGADLAGQAVRLGLVDEFRIIRGPAVLGGGTPYFPPIEHALPLELVETRAYASGALLERYRTIR